MRPALTSVTHGLARVSRTRKLRSADDENAKDRILNEAARLFEIEGYEKTSIREVIARSQSSNATLVRYFGNKSGLFAAFVARFGQRMSDLLRLANIEDPEEALVEIGRRLLSHFLPKMTPYRAALGVVNNHARVGQILYQNVRDPMVRLVAEHLRKWVREGKLRVSDVEADAARFYRLLTAGVYERVLYGIQSVGSESEIDAAARGATRVFLHGVSAPNPLDQR